MEAREAIVADLKEIGALKEVEELTHDVGTCYRCHTTIEPMVSKQWFVKMAPLAKPAIDVVRNGDTSSSPKDLKRFTSIGWRISRIGVFLVSFGGDTDSCMVLR